MRQTALNPERLPATDHLGPAGPPYPGPLAWAVLQRRLLRCQDLSRAQRRKPLLLFKDAERPTWWTKRTLGPRLAWLFENEILPKRLQALASVVKDDGNDGAHEGTVNKKSAEELVNFTERLLTELYTEPERIKMAVARRAEPNDEGA